MPRKHNLLYIDDEKRSLTAFRMTFEDEFNIFTASDCREAYAILQERSIQLIVADQRMPEETGVEFLKRIRAEFPLTIRTILTGYSDIEAIIDAINKSQIYYYFKKPWNEEELKMVFRNAIEAVELTTANSMLTRDLKDALAQLEHKAEELKKQVRQRQDLVDELERSNSVKSQFLSIISHELRTPLNPIIGFTDIMLRSCPEGDFRSNLEMISRCSRDLLTMINGILEFMQSENAAGTLEPEVISVREIVGDALNLARTLLTKKPAIFVGASYALDGKPTSELPPIIALQGPLRQILSNLVTNACKFTNAGSITIECLLERPTPAESWLQISVIDTGVGIDPKHHETIFEAFSQVDQTLSRPYEGLGLGLAICRQQAERLHGVITLESEPDKGSAFRLRIPAQLAPSPSDPRRPPSKRIESPVHGLTALVVDDNEFNRSMLVTMLSKLGCATASFENGEAALDALRAEPVDLVFLDLLMPGLDGFEVAQRIRSMDLSKQPKLIAVTADLTDKARNALKSSGIDSVLYKPLSIGDLAGHLHQHC